MSIETAVPQRFKRSPVNESAKHLFELGQLVHLNNGLAPSGNIYRITAKLPTLGDSPQYRVQNDLEKFERMATQSSLEAVSATTPAPLAETTFATGPTARSQSLLSPQAQAAIGAGASVPQPE